MTMILLKSKLHHLRITRVDMEYEGSLLVDASLLAAAGMRDFEKILVANLANGERFETYAIPGRPGSGEVCLNGAAARTVSKVLLAPCGRMRISEPVSCPDGLVISPSPLPLLAVTSIG